MCLASNAGDVAIPKPFEETAMEEMDRVININVRGVFVSSAPMVEGVKQAESKDFPSRACPRPNGLRETR